MSGMMFRDGFLSLLNHGGCTVVVHRKRGYEEQPAVELRALKNHTKGERNDIFFQFPERQDIAAGDLLQQKGAADFWEVYDTEDQIFGDVFSDFKVRVRKRGAAPPHHHGGVVIHGPNFGGIQLNTSHSVQNVSVNPAVIGSPVVGLRELLRHSDIDPLDREEGEAALARIEQLAEKEKSPSVAARVKEKLDVVSGILSVGKELAGLAAPHIDSIGRYFGLTLAS